jgi:hypothetical protein
MNRNLALILGGCAVLLVCVCLASGIIIVVAGNQISQILAQTTQQLQPSEARVPTVPETTGETPFPSEQATAVPTKPSGGLPSGGNPFADALGKAKTATKYRVQFNWVFGGMQNGKYVEQPFFDFTGEVDGTNSHLVSQGGFLAMLGGDNSTIEITQADGKEYMKGISMFGTTDPKVWYIQKDTSTTSGFSDFTKPDYFSDFTGNNMADYKKTGSESLDNQSCDVYLYDAKSLQNTALIGLLGSAQDKTDFSAIDKAEMKAWLCGDGYVHKFTMDYEGHDSKDVNSKGALKMNIHVWDFNNPAISVQAPKDAKPMPGQ